MQFLMFANRAQEFNLISKSANTIQADEFVKYAHKIFGTDQITDSDAIAVEGYIYNSSSKLLIMLRTKLLV
jgi:hypothetical protein